MDYIISNHSIFATPLHLAEAIMIKGGRSVLGSVLSVIDEIRFLENGNRLVPKIFRNRAFRFSVISVRFRI